MNEKRSFLLHCQGLTVGEQIRFSADLRNPKAQRTRLYGKCHALFACLIFGGVNALVLVIATRDRSDRDRCHIMEMMVFGFPASGNNDPSSKAHL